MSGDTEEIKYKGFFEEADTDKDGFLTFEELKSTLRQRGYTGTDERIKAMFTAVDDSGDKKISYDEYMTAMGQMANTDHMAAATRLCFRQFDKNGDGKIDRGELKTVFRELGRYMTPDELDRIMKMADTDQSGTLEYDEFVNEVFGLAK